MGSCGGSRAPVSSAHTCTLVDWQWLLSCAHHCGVACQAGAMAYEHVHTVDNWLVLYCAVFSVGKNLTWRRLVSESLLKYDVSASQSLSKVSKECKAVPPVGSSTGQALWLPSWEVYDANQV